MGQAAAATGARLGFTKINVRDFDGMIAFYGKVFGLQRGRTFEFPDMIETLLNAPGQEDGPYLVILQPYDDDKLEVGTAWGPLGFYLDDVDATYARALSNGATSDVEPFNYTDLRIAMIFDPEGHRIELVGAPGSAKE